MTRGHDSRPIAVVFAFLFVWAMMSLPVLADAPTAPAATGTEDFGQYLADHQADLAPFFSKNASDLFRLAVPLLMGIMGWVVLITMLVGWGIDVLMSRGFAFFYAPAHAEIKRSLIYATGRLFLSFVYTCLLGVAVVFSLKLTYGVAVMSVAVAVLVLVAIAAQIVWVLYLYRTTFMVSLTFYIAIIVVHSVVGVLLAKPLFVSRASTVATEFVDQAITPRLQAEADSTKQELDGIASDRDAAKEKVTELQNQIAQAKSDQEQIRNKIEEKKHSDAYVFSQIVQLRARGELDSARQQLTAFLSKFPSSSLDALAQAQLQQVNDQMAAQAEQKQQETADAARAAAQARADLLARAAKGEVPLSEMRHALIGKSRAEVSELLGAPSATASDSWNYNQTMIYNPVTNEKHGLTVYFSEGLVQSVDYGGVGIGASQ